MKINNWKSPFHIYTLLLIVAILFFIQCSNIQVLTTPTTNDTSNSSSESQYGGALKGSFSVSNDGGGTYKINIDVPPGTHKVQPQLSFSYSSNRGNGMMGLGWGLQGLSSIQRQAATIAQDGFSGSINYDANDRFALNGQRLMQIQAYNTDSVEYHTENETWSKVMAYYTENSCGGGPCSFKVTNKRGYTIEYGNTSDARIEAVGMDAVRVWAINKITDLNGNYMTFSYEEDTVHGAYYPSQINYTGNDNSNPSLNPERQILFNYLDTRQDTVPMYLGGAAIQYNQLLESIQTYVSGDLVTQYNMYYSYSTTTNRSLLDSIGQCDANNKCLPAMEFTWQQGDNSYSKQDTLSTSNITHGLSNIPTPVDVNGDGLYDLVNYWADESDFTLQYSLFTSDGTQLQESGTVVNTTYPTNANYPSLFTGDINGDGQIDLAYPYQGSDTDGTIPLELVPLLSNGEGFDSGTANSYDAINIEDNGSPYMVAGDYNGDGLNDLVFPYEYNETLGIQLLLSNGNALELSTDTTYANLTTFSNTSFYLFSGNINGDAMSDLLYAYNNDNETISINVLRATGNGFTIAQTLETTIPATESQNYLPMDINGDSFIDLVCTWYDGSQTNMQVFLSNGQTLNPANTDIVFPTFTALSATMYPMEINGDGMSDIMYVYPDEDNNLQFQPYLSNGVNFVADDLLPSMDIPWTNTPYTTLAMDINGDSKTDMVHLAADDSNNDSNNNTNLIPIMANSAYPDLLVKVSNGIDGSIDIDYLPMTNQSIYTEDTSSNENGLAHFSKHNGSSFFSGNISSMNTGNNSIGQAGTAYPIVNAAMPNYLVYTYTKNDGNGNSYEYSHHYSDAKNDMNGRGWMGFRSKTLTDYSVGTISTSYYHQLFPMTGSVDSSIVQTLEGNERMTKNTLTYQDSTAVVNGGKDTIHIVQKSQSISDYYDYGTFAYSLKKTFEYDQYGNTIYSIDYGTSDSALYKINVYENDTSNWQLGYITESKAASDPEGDNLLIHKKFQYDDETRNLLQKQMWLDQNNTWIDTSYVYDDFGNKIQVIDPSNDTTHLAYDATYQTFMVKKTSPPNQNGLQLVSQYDYLPQFGQIRKMSDPNNDSLVVQFDGLGRITAVQTTSPSGDFTTIGTIAYYLDSEAGYYQQKRMLLTWEDTTMTLSNKHYDGLLRNYKTTQLADNDQTIVTTQEMNSKGKILQKSLPYYQGDTPQYIRIEYDPYSRVDRMVRPKENGDSTVVTTAYSGKTFTVRQAVDTPDSTHLIIHYDYYNTQKKYTQKLNASNYNNCNSVSGYDTTYFYYDALGRATQAKDPTGTLNTAGYNSLNQKIQLVTESMGNTQTLINIPDRIVQTVRASLDTITYVFDALNRPISKTLPDGTQVTFEYDLAEYANSLGRLSTVTMPYDGQVAEYTYSYDDQGNTDSVRLSINGNTYVQAAQYNPNQTLSQFAYPDASTLNMSYTLDGLQSMDVTDTQDIGTGNYLNINSYDAMGNVLEAVYGNGVAANYTYTPMGNLNSYQLAGPDSTLLNHAYSWNYVSQIDTILDLVDSNYSQFFEYDKVERLTHAQGIYGNQSYCYDASGNITFKDNINYTYDHYQVTQGTDSDGNTTFEAQYDVNGNMIQRIEDNDTTTYDYDSQNRLLQVTRNDTLLYKFVYDYTNRRILKVDSVNLTTTLYVSDQYEITQYGQDSTAYTKYVQGQNGNIASITYTEYANASSNSSSTADNDNGIPNTGVLYFHQDHLQSTKLTTDPSGHLSTQVVYMPFGEIYEKASFGPDNFRAKYGGKELDEESELYYFSARYYDPKLARFITADTQLGGHTFQHDVFNRYAYTLNNPVKYTDPSGHSVKGIITSVLVTTAIIVGEAALDVVTLGAAVPEEAALDAAAIGAEVAIEAGTDAAADAGADLAADGAADAVAEGTTEEGAATMTESSTAEATSDVTATEESMGAGSEEGSMDDIMSGNTSTKSSTDADKAGEHCKCFTAGTLIATEEGEKPIEEIKLGDRVWAYNPETCENELHKVTTLFNRVSDTLYVIQVGTETIETTPEHPFWVDGKWIKAKNLQVGQFLKGIENEYYPIEAIERQLGKYEVFNFEVEGVHNYYVSGAKVLVHNVGCRKFKRAKNNILEGKGTNEDYGNVLKFLTKEGNSRGDKHGMTNEIIGRMNKLFKNNYVGAHGNTLEGLLKGYNVELETMEEANKYQRKAIENLVP